MLYGQGGRKPSLKDNVNGFGKGVQKFRPQRDKGEHLVLGTEASREVRGLSVSGAQLPGGSPGHEAQGRAEQRTLCVQTWGAGLLF